MCRTASLHTAIHTPLRTSTPPHSHPPPQVAYRMVDVAGNVGVKVDYQDQEMILTPERVRAMRRTGGCAPY